MQDRHPFFTDNFSSNWLDYFKNGDSSLSFKFIQPLRFTRKKWYHFNVGKNITNGIFYSLNDQEQDFKGKVFLLYDVLPDLVEPTSSIPKNLGMKKVKQYKGYLSRLDQFDTFEDFFAKQYSSKSRNNLRKCLKRLEANFDIKFEVYHGDMSRELYDFIFEKLIQLIEKRFGELELSNNILNLKDYYYNLLYKMVVNKEASFNVLYNDSEPIAISVCFLSEDRSYFAITTFDTNYRRYNLGHVMIINLLKWCFENGYKVLDYSKGTYDYKLRWSNEPYCFENHILYDKRSLKSVVIANILSYYFGFKQYLRDVNFNKFYSKLKYSIKKKPLEKTESSTVMDITEAEFNISKFTPVALEKINGHELQAVVYDILFSKPQHVNNIQLFKNNEDGSYVIKGKSLLQKINFG